ncbi:hypothetical protein P10VF_179 [Rhizobium phage vB_RleM_P10VF]|uniref:Uncharacterized protein n=1 Tax=Rhizobium phage vB_RleM_P10VF TaxID=1527770 RepID=A0A076YKS3_9CAUD|nr:hypothetical protein P10VF_179 [Rhizobium phage vB_RleM_P10VF]AIK68392.1 hypothetical protein P10VF_179 [Rhizobium phage vB_RleM_P10VF]
MKEVKLLVVEGLDRTGKDTLCERFHYDSDVCWIKYNDFNHQATRDEYYNTTRTMMKHPSNRTVSKITTAMAIAEFLQVLSYIKFSIARGLTEFVVTRAFPSTIVFDEIRGIANDIEVTIKMMREHFEIENDIKIDMRLLTLFISPDHMKARGSTEDSFEIKNYEKISQCFERYTEYESSSRLIFSKARNKTINEWSEDQLFEYAKNFLFQS